MPKAVNLEGNFTEEQNARANRCESKIRKDLDDDDCKLVVAHFIAKDGRPQAEIHVIPNLAKADATRSSVIQVVHGSLQKSVQPNGKPILLE